MLLDGQDLKAPMYDPNYTGLKIATKDEFNAVYNMALNFIANSPYKRFPVAYRKVSNLIDELMQDPKSLVLVYLIEGIPVGMIGAKCEELYFSDMVITLEIAWWVDPQYRNGKVGLELMKAYEYWATNVVHADIVQMSLLQEDETLKKLYKRKGYELSEQTFIKETFYLWPQFPQSSQA